MKLKKKIAILSMSSLLLAGAITSVSAYVYVSGTKYQTVAHKDIPGYGGYSYDTYYGSKKATNGSFATFTKTYGEAALGNFGELISSSKKHMSEVVGMRLNDPTLATLYGCSKGTVYFSAVTSSGIEPSNKCDVTMKFSADNLKPE